MTDLLGRLKREGSPEHRKSPEQCLLLVAQQAMAPVNRRGQRLLALDPAAASGQQTEAIRQALEDLGWSQVCGPSCSELDRQRDCVVTAADLGHVVLAGEATSGSSVQ